LTKARERKKKTLKPASQAETGTPVAALPARMRTVYRPERTKTSSSSLRFR
jgi:hypothetical protein